MFQQRTLIIVFVIVALGLAFVTFFFRSNQTKPKEKVKASSASSTITTQADWEIGSYDAAFLSILSGSISINTSNPISLSTLYNTDHSRLTATENSDNAPLAFDAFDATTWEPICTGSDHNASWQFDLGASMTISTLHINYIEDCNGVSLYYSVNGSDWTNVPMGFGGGAGHGDVDLGAGITARYLKVQMNVVASCTYCGTPGLHDIQITGSYTVTHTTGATQIDGGSNFWQWETFTDSKTTPANTSVTYRYRTSTNGTDWTGWVGDIGSVTSRTGDDSNNPTKYRYLQIEATLSNTDGASTPTIDSYSIGFHTNRKPNAPTAMTAVVN